MATTLPPIWALADALTSAFASAPAFASAAGAAGVSACGAVDGASAESQNFARLVDNNATPRTTKRMGYLLDTTIPAASRALSRGWKRERFRTSWYGNGFRDLRRVSPRAFRCHAKDRVQHRRRFVLAMLDRGRDQSRSAGACAGRSGERVDESCRALSAERLCPSRRPAWGRPCGVCRPRARRARCSRSSCDRAWQTAGPSLE